MNIEKLYAIIKLECLKTKYKSRLLVGAMPVLSLSTKLRIGEKAKLKIGNGVKTFDSVNISVVSGECSIGEHTAFNRNCIIVCKLNISIGKMCRFVYMIMIINMDIMAYIMNTIVRQLLLVMDVGLAQM